MTSKNEVHVFLTTKAISKCYLQIINNSSPNRPRKKQATKNVAGITSSLNTQRACHVLYQSENLRGDAYSLTAILESPIRKASVSIRECFMAERIWHKIAWSRVVSHLNLRKTMEVLITEDYGRPRFYNKVAIINLGKDLFLTPYYRQKEAHNRKYKNPWRKLNDSENL